MRVYAKQNIYIRTAIKASSAPIGIIFKDTVLEVEDHSLIGEAPSEPPGNTNNIWYKDLQKNWFYWSGSLDVIDKRPEQEIWKYRELLNLPEAWRDSNGEGIRIAVIDLGFDLDNPNLLHLNLDGHRFDLTPPDFDPQTAEGNDNVQHRNPTDYHGSECAGILAANGALQGVVPGAEMFFFKVAPNNFKQLLHALHLADRLGIDVVSISLTYPDPFVAPTYSAFRQPFETILGKIQQKICIVSTLENPENLLDELNRVPFPANRKANTLAVGGIGKVFLDAFATRPNFSENIDLLLHMDNFKVCSPGEPKVVPLYSSYATPYVAGIAALYLSYFRKATMGQSPALQDVVQAIKQELSQPYSNLVGNPDAKGVAVVDPASGA